MACPGKCSFTIPQVNLMALRYLKGTNELSSAEEARCAEIIAHFRSLIAERRLLLTPFFKVFDKVSILNWAV